MTGTISELDHGFGIPGIARIVEGNGGLPKVMIACAQAAGEMYLHGGHVTSWQPTGAAEEVLFVSEQSRWETGRAIRGGIPICFPWFGGKADDPEAPAHGFVRTKSWQIESIAHTGGAVTVSMFTASNEDTKKRWPADFRLVHRVTFGSKLGLEVAVTNTGRSPLRFEEALHTYHRVGNVTNIRVSGLDSVYYLDKTDANRKKLQHGDVEIDSETDRVYLNTEDAINLRDPVFRRRIHIQKSNSSTTVVWNPWMQKALSFSDFGPNEWKQMVCIETSNVADFAVALGPGQQHSMKAVVSLDF